jgi:tRNA A-37 threonylcarbamoyl transferase component Bud32
MDSQKHCSGCNKPLALNAPQGLCPECLIKAGLGTGVDIGPETEAGGPGIPFTPPKPEALAQHFSQLEILEFIGQGGMGAVYKVRQKQLDRIVALKILPPQAASGTGFAERFTREARALAKLNHPHIVTLYEFGQTNGLFYFLMEFVDGANLRQLLNAGRIDPKAALAIVPQICDALQFAHERGIVHRDIKPENILLSLEGRIKIADFGVAKIMAQASDETSVEKISGAPSGEMTEAGSVLGTPQYMAPEQFAHPLEVDHRADIYSLGVVLYQMLTGELPSGKFEPPSKKVNIDVRLDEIVLRALEQEPELRYQQVSEVKTLVETIAATQPGGTQREQARSEQPEFAPRFSRTSIVGGCWALPIAFLALFMPWTGALTQYAGPAWWRAFCTFFYDQGWPMFNPNAPAWQIFTLLPLGLTAPFGTTILGWMAVSQIRCSRGKLYGMWLALVGGLLFPILILDAALLFEQVAVYGSIKGNVFNVGINPFLFFLMLQEVLTADYFIIRLVWRAVNRPLDGTRNNSWGKIITIGCAVLAVTFILAAGIAYGFARIGGPDSDGSDSDGVSPASSAQPASDLVVAGEDVSWSDGYVLHVAKRDGSSLKGIRVVHKDASGQLTTITAGKGTLTLGSVTTTTDGVVTSTNDVMIDLQDAYFQNATTNQVIKELSIVLHQFTQLTGDSSQLKTNTTALNASNRWLEDLMAGPAASIWTNLLTRTNTYSPAVLTNVGLHTLDDAIQTTLYALSSSNPQIWSNATDPDSRIFIGVGPQTFEDCRKRLIGLSTFAVTWQRDYLDGHVELTCELHFDAVDASGKPTLLMIALRPNNGQWCLDSVMPVTITYADSEATSGHELLFPDLRAKRFP